MEVILIGSTGAVGKVLLNKLITHNQISKVYLIQRSDNVIVNDKIKLLKVDNICNLDAVYDKLKGKNIFGIINSIGSRVSHGKELFVKIDRDSVVSSFNLLKKLKGKYFLNVSTVSANKNSMFLYLKTKGECEQLLKEEYLKDNNLSSTMRVSIFRPGVILNRSKDFRIGELFLKYTPFFSKIECTTLADKILADLLNYYNNKNQAGYNIFENSDIKNIV